MVNRNYSHVAKDQHFRKVLGSAEIIGLQLGGVEQVKAFTS